MNLTVYLETYRRILGLRRVGGGILANLYGP